MGMHYKYILIFMVPSLDDDTEKKSARKYGSVGPYSCWNEDKSDLNIQVLVCSLGE